MKISSDIKAIRFPFSYFFKGWVFGKRVYIRKSIIDDLKSKHPKPESMGVLYHEQEHIKRINKYGKLKFSWNYWTSRKFRFQEEIAANIPQMKYLKKHGGKFDIKKRAKNLSGPIYLWCVNYKEAKLKLTKIWNKL